MNKKENESQNLDLCSPLPLKLHLSKLPIGKNDSGGLDRGDFRGKFHYAFNPDFIMYFAVKK